MTAKISLGIKKMLNIFLRSPTVGEEWLKGKQRNLGSCRVSERCPKASSKSNFKSKSKSKPQAELYVEVSHRHPR